ncbi:dehydrogenase/reductase SDR family member 4 isoform X2 [Microcaecilia unicolor]|nr:dehydrogenase/reductase SDR family member 4-like isoform X2 [Microcaecilia unicolor]XP_030043635.1 dehydrogenase/reductase SDR family member 4-like isoform X2 [Microcaecilia unicolor]XP_030043637.1 dehydrogenase/reductase SDR family member 4-like isoform X2 [Microcaecilia unicolor]
MLSSLRVLRPAVQSWPRMHTTASQGVLADKVALVTASTDGIGLAIARRLAQDGAKVMLSSRKQENVEKTVAQLRAENLNVKGTVCHVGKEKDREGLVIKAVEEYGGIDILVCNAAVNPYFGNMLDSTEEVWDKILDVNVKATFLLVKKVVPHMEKRGGGSIVIVSSLAAYSPYPSLGPYSVSKTALVGLTKAFVPELALMNIRINCLAPGLIKTKFSSMMWQNESIEKQLLAVLGTHRIGEAQECAGIASFLCSPDAAYINGETIVVAGGSRSRL